MPKEMNWNNLLNATRLGGVTITPQSQDYRSPFEADADRVAFCSGFRRLSKKTQVHPFPHNDHTHTRLTHSIEVASVGQTLGRAVGDKLKDKLPDEMTSSHFAAILRAVCLAHDIGNPAFGHAGEEVITQWFQDQGKDYLSGFNDIRKKDIATFEGNAQGFRMVTQTENYIFAGGLRLSYATLATFLKYPWTVQHADESNKFGCFLSEVHILEDIAEKVGLISKGTNCWARHPLAFLAEAADDICYSVIDLEDAVELELLSYEEAYDTFIGVLNPEIRAQVDKELRKSKNSFRVNFARLRGPVFAALMEQVVETFFQNYEQIMSGELDTSLFKSMPKDSPQRNAIDTAKRIGREKVYPNNKKVQLELGCYAIFESILELFAPAAIECAEKLCDDLNHTEISKKSELVLRLLGEHKPTKENAPGPEGVWNKYECLRRTIDFVSGMTDNYAMKLSSQLRGIPFRL